MKTLQIHLTWRKLQNSSRWLNFPKTCIYIRTLCSAYLFKTALLEYNECTISHQSVVVGWSVSLIRFGISLDIEKAHFLVCLGESWKQDHGVYTWSLTSLSLALFPLFDLQHPWTEHLCFIIEFCHDIPALELGDHGWNPLIMLINNRKANKHTMCIMHNLTFWYMCIL